ncbi:HipA domain-containing protein [Glaesserella parasuis]|uniref:type II toxin-antitoxin system HipA family toxin n=1 Tax=Glaesserella parasuis TaxID=738 RepID=UPI0013232734|nr:HipA domain-containing protein [Glaesserella parasuis]MCT8571003.1 HipA domain-containing protein [Glaesserella parasuis]MCT8684945.1 HipA domain-containing protein [Glaesserella parasuis]MCT8737312.1 HipA domain-containing protein [Glaesserella parasuis]MCT8751789.1 HipA domain-containing protein [Glaesserella parasuis]MCT8758036.1 HipA domain-containing protein [Glaesserella parasuis]
MQIEPLILQAYIADRWQDIAILTFQADYSLNDFSYLHDLTEILSDNDKAVSFNYPVEFFPHRSVSGWFAFLDDIVPSGASRRYWLQKLDIAHLPMAQQNYLLLKQGTIAPVGHLRVKQAVSSFVENEPSRLFEIDDVINRQADFLEYANQRGAMAGGATGAGGEAPKLLLRQTATRQVWIDNLQQGASSDDFYLVKFPRGKRSVIDCDILRTEFHYYHELASMGFDTIDTTKMRLEEGERYPSLWLPRFDVYRNEQGKMARYAVESVYAMLEKGAGSLLDHEKVIRQLIAKIETSHLVETGMFFDKQAFVIEWVRRDLLNIAFGNSDNHGRNTAFLRNQNRIWLAPIYDFAPMKADPEGIPRTTMWDSKGHPALELGGEYRFDLIAEQLDDLCPADKLLDALRQTAQQLVGLKARLEARGVPTAILTYPSISLDYLPEKLKRWQLLS